MLYRCCGSYASGPPVYGAHPDDPGDHFDLSHVTYVTVNGEHLVLFRYVQGNAVWQDFAFFVGSLNYAGALPVIGPNNRYQPVGPNLVIMLHTLQGSDAMCCPSGPWRTVATLSANSHGLFTPSSTPSPGVASAATSAQQAAVAALISLDRANGITDIEGPRCFIVQTYAECAYGEGGKEGDEAWALLQLKNGTWALLEGNGGEVTTDRGIAQFGSFEAMLEKQYGIPASVAKQFAAKINDL